MKNKFMYNVIYDSKENDFQDTIEDLITDYIKQILNGNNCNKKEFGVL